MEHEATKKLLFITGAGASASLSKKDSSTIAVFGFGKYQTLPLGNELVARIVAYKSKTFFWLVSLFCWRLVNDFEGDWQNKFFDFLGKLSQKSYQDSEKDDLVKVLFLTLIEHSIEKLGNLLKAQDQILTEIFLNDLWNKITEILKALNPLKEAPQRHNHIKNTFDIAGIYEKQNYTWKQAQEKILKPASSQENYDVAEGLKKMIGLAKEAQVLDKKELIQAHFSINGLFGIKHALQARNYGSLIDENVLKNIQFFEKNLLEISQNFDSEEKFLMFERILNCFENFSLNENRFYLINPFDKIFEETQRIRSQILREILPTSGDLENQNFISIIEHLKKLLVSASIVESGQPYSIDYFMMNLRQLAPYEFFDSVGKKLNKKEAKKREKEIQKYTKFIIAECLGNSALFAKFESQWQDNYLKRLRWKILENAFFYYRTLKGEKAFEEYLKNDVKIITFNYENSLELLALESFEIEVAKHFSKNNISHVYGSLELKVDLEENGKKISQNRSNWSEDALLKSLFCDDVCDDKKIKLFPGFFGDDKTYLCKNLFEQIDKSMKWIGENDQEKILKDRKKYQDQFNEAGEIYFLGFGFDSENLYRLGIINKNQQLENSVKLQGKKILISGANPKIIGSVKNIFETSEQIVETTLTTLLKPDLDFKILLSSKFLPEALSEDL